MGGGCDGREVGGVDVLSVDAEDRVPYVRDVGDEGEGGEEVEEEEETEEVVVLGEGGDDDLEGEEAEDGEGDGEEHGISRLGEQPGAEVVHEQDEHGQSHSEHSEGKGVEEVGDSQAPQLTTVNDVTGRAMSERFLHVEREEEKGADGEGKCPEWEWERLVVHGDSAAESLAVRRGV